jgi:CRISPR-associated protein Csh1
MLDTLKKLGEQKRVDDPIKRILMKPKKIKGTAIVEVIFDLDTKQVSHKLHEFSATDDDHRYSMYQLRCIAIRPARWKKVYLTTNPQQYYEAWKTTLFGKIKESEAGELTEAILKTMPHLASSQLCDILNEVFQLKQEFNNKFSSFEQIITLGKPPMNAKEIAVKVNDMALIFASVVSTKLGISEPIPMAKLNGYDDFLFSSKETESADTEGEDNLKVCYVTGEKKNDVSTANFESRDSNMNIMFVKTTKNYLSNFDTDLASYNYQISDDSKIAIEAASAFLLSNTVKIAGVSHCIIPQFLHNENVDFNQIYFKFKIASELLFSMSKQGSTEGSWKNFELDFAQFDIFWISFLGYDTDGKYFKTINLIKDINKTHFSNTLETLENIDEEMSNSFGEVWERAMTSMNWKEKKEDRYNFNFYTIYNLIPFLKKKDPDKKPNPPLLIFKAILEQRPIERDKIFEYFNELVLCHWYKRYDAYENVYGSKETNFHFSIQSPIYQYLAFIKFLRLLNLLKNDDMENQNEPIVQNSTEPTNVDAKKFQKIIDSFFENMNYTKPQKAMFYLGRLLRIVSDAQYDKKHESRPILNKVNFNGLELKAIQRLSLDLMEKAVMYDETRTATAILNLFNENFKYDHEKPETWKMKPDEALFYLLSGYVFNPFTKS